ncbi:uncharacterized protein C7orf72 homolog [Acanthaster planci]|uniref:Uncharacterized protein C7orf72 homolog n=1 Tax=Acanthaster planci TaxID=133434 RepID=A0A8B7ZX38_ACAPL|nr:uncharacterized protein C7orf72 homolog [Acanthaster planci]
MEDAFNTHASTTYRISYPPHTCILPPIKFHQLPAIQLRDKPKLAPREFPISPAGPSRGWEKGTGQVLLPDIKSFIDKPIVRDPPPQKKVINPPPEKPKPRQKADRQPKADNHEPDDPLQRLAEPLPPVVLRCTDGYPEKIEEGWVEELCRSYHWKTSSKEAAKEGCLRVPELKPPLTTMEPRSDFLSYRSMRYDSRQLPWQRVAPVWDRVQERPHVGCNVTSRLIGGGAVKATTENAKQSASKKKEDIALDDKILQLVREEKVPSMFVRKCPGYAGYVPRSPLRVSMETASIFPDQRTMSTMKSSYRTFPTREYAVKEFAHKGPLSRTVTLTYPYNPYNKVESRAEEIEHKW